MNDRNNLRMNQIEAFSWILFLCIALMSCDQVENENPVVQYDFEKENITITEPFEQERKSMKERLSEQGLTPKGKDPFGNVIYLNFCIIVLEEVHVELNDTAMAKRILEDHEVLIKNMRSVLTIAEDVEDEGTVDMISSFLAEIEKNSWMIDAWITQEKDQPAHAKA